MKYKSTILILLAAVSVLAQQSNEEAAPSGTPALLVTANGKKAKVNLQSMAGGNLTFAAGSRSMTVPADKISSLNFSMSKEEFDFYRAEQTISDEQISEIFNKENLERAQKLEAIFQTILANIEGYYNEADYASAIKALEPLMKERGQFMAIENNLENYYVMLMESYRKTEDFSNMKICAETLAVSSDSDKVTKAKASQALAAIAGEDLAKAEALKDEMGSEAARLYLEACILRAKEEPKEAFLTVTTIIADHANDMEWLPQSELLSAYLYLDMTGTNSVITTNSAINTARQVKNIYAGSSVAGDAKKLWVSLGGEKIEAEEAAAKAAREAAAAEAKAKREAERIARKEAEAAEKAAKAAAEAAAAETNATAKVESE